MFQLTDSEKNARYVDYYDMCDVYKSEKIPECEVRTRRSSVGPAEAQARERSQFAPDARLVSFLGYPLYSNVMQRREERVVPLLASAH